MYLVLGEALMDMVSQATGAYVPVPGGAPYNFARALALQGVACGYLNALSDDHFGAALRSALLDAGAQHLGRITQKPTSLAFVAKDANGQPHYSFYRADVADRDFDAQLLAIDRSVTGIHTGGLALVPPDHQHPLRYLQHFCARGALCSVDLNMRPAVARSMGVELASYREAALACASLANVVKVSDEDLLNLGISDAPLQGARTLLEHGPSLVILTLGASGAWALTRTREIFQAANCVQVVDSVGAGDCFFAGFIAALARRNALVDIMQNNLDAATLEFALKHANTCAAINLTREGCAPPSWDEANAAR